MHVPNRYDNTIQMYVEGVREPDMRHLHFLRWLAERGALEHEIAGPSSGALIAPLTPLTSERTALGVEPEMVTEFRQAGLSVADREAARRLEGMGYPRWLAQRAGRRREPPAPSGS